MPGENTAMGAAGTEYPCPFCGTMADLTSGCPGCRRPPDPVAAEVIRLDREIAALHPRVEQARQAYLALVGRLQQTQARRNQLAAQVRAARAGAAATPGQAAPSPRPPITPQPTPAVEPPIAAETSTRIVQNLLFILGGLLLGSAAIVFTLVAWATFGIAGRAAILAAVTVLMLAAPLLAMRRRLTATAETFAAVGLLLVVLDGYAAWAVDLFGLADWPGGRYAAAVAAVTTAVAAGYGAATGLRAPRFAALLVAQPVLPLLAVDLDLGSFGWSFVFAAVAALDLAAVRMIRTGPGAVPLRIVAWVAYGLTLVVSGMYALWAVTSDEVTSAAVLVGAPLLLVALLLVTAGMVARSTALQAIAAAVLVVALVIALVRPISLLRPTFLLVGSAVAVALVVGAVVGVARWLPAPVRPGPRIGGLVTVVSVALVVAGMTLVVALVSVVESLPPWRADVDADIPFDWQLPVAVALLTAALAASLPRPAREPVGVAGVGFAVLAAPAAVAWPWWVTPAVELSVAVALLLAAAGCLTVAGLGRRSGTDADPGAAGSSGGIAGDGAVLVRVGTAVILAGHAVLVALARPAAEFIVLAVITLTGLVVSAFTARSSAPDRLRRAIGGCGLAVGMLTWPLTVTVGLFALHVQPWWQARAALAATALLVPALVSVRRWWPSYQPYAGLAVTVVALVVGIAPDISGVAEPPGIYAGLGLLVLAAALPLAGRGQAVRAVAPAGILLVRCALAVLPAVGAVLVSPYFWLDAIWSGAPDGVGLKPTGGSPVDWRAAVTLAVLTVAFGLAGFGWRATLRAAARVAAPVGAVALLVALAAAGAPWPTVPVVSLVVGLAALLVGALARAAQRIAPVGVPLGAVLVAPGLAGNLPTKATTLVALGLVIVAAAVVGTAGRTLLARVVGWLAAGTGGLCFALAAALAAELPLRMAAFTVLAAAAVAVGLGAALRVRRPVESVVVEAAGHAGALVALLLTVGHLRYAAAVCTVWGVVVGVRALRPGESSRRRWIFAVVAAVSELLAAWLLLAAAQVAVLEAYTLPAAGLALVAGWLALRTRPGLSSWVTYGPGLAAALLPTLVSILVAPGQPWRRLLLGVGALAVVMLGAAWRRQAPVLLGGAALVVLALHEIVQVWDEAPRWIFLAVGGLLLIGLAMTYEQRRRDLARLRDTIGRMR